MPTFRDVLLWKLLPYTTAWGRTEGLSKQSSLFNLTTAWASRIDYRDYRRSDAGGAGPDQGQDQVAGSKLGFPVIH